MYSDAARQMYQDELKGLQEAGLFKQERFIHTPQGAQIEVEFPSGAAPKKVLNFCANNYLGMSSHPDVVKAFVALKKGYEVTDDLELEIMNFIRKRLSPLAMPQEIEFVKSLPKTRSGKIMRRVLRAKEFNEPVGDLSSLEND